MLTCLLLLISTAACSGDPSIQAKYEPVFLPVEFSWDSSNPGHISISGELSRVTPIGVFSVGAQYTVPGASSESLRVIIRDRSTPPGFDYIYNVTSGSSEFEAVVDGRTTIQVVNRQVLIDVTDSRVQHIQFKEVQASVAESGSSIVERWDTYSATSIYHPFALARWAYDDSTIGSWYGIGFAWFLVRLALTIVLGLVDIALTLVFYVAGVSYLLFGLTGRNIIYGLAALLVICLVGAASIAAWLDL